MFERIIDVWLPDFSLSFLSILVEGAPFILLGTLISGFLDVYLPSNAIDRFLPRNQSRAVLVSGLLGIVFPVCECAVVPVIRKLVQKGLSPACALTYMLAAPIVNPVTAFSTAKAFKDIPLEMAGSRLIFGYLVAVFVGLILLRIPVRALLKSRLVDDLEQAAKARELGKPQRASHPEGSRLIMSLRAAMRDFVDVGIYFAIGITIVSILRIPPPFENAMPLREIIQGAAENTYSAVATMMGLAFLLSLCSTSDAFIAASMQGDFAIGALLSFLVFGPMMDVKLLFLYSTVLTRKFILYLAMGLFLGIGAIGVFMTPIFQPDPKKPPARQEAK